MGIPFDALPAAVSGDTAGRDILSRLDISLPNLYLPDWLPWLELHAHHPALLWVPVLLAAGR